MRAVHALPQLVRHLAVDPAGLLQALVVASVVIALFEPNGITNSVEVGLPRWLRRRRAPVEPDRAEAPTSAAPPASR